MAVKQEFIDGFGPRQRGILRALEETYPEGLDARALAGEVCSSADGGEAWVASWPRSVANEISRSNRQAREEWGRPVIENTVEPRGPGRRANYVLTEWGLALAMLLPPEDD